MELGLNLFWLLLVIASLVWRLKSRWPRHRSRRSKHGLFAMGCALTILFPIVSLTDNLHGENAALQDSSSRTLKKWSGNGTSSNLTRFSTFPVCPPAPFCFSCGRRCLGQTASAVLNLLRPAGTWLSDGRAPPHA